MANAWDQAADMADKHAKSGGIFVRLAGDGDRVVGAFCGKPLPREVVWVGDRYEPYDSNVHTDKKPTFKVMLNFYTDGMMKIIEGGTVWFKDILKLRDKYGLDKWAFEVQRHGAAGDTKTKYTILPEKQLTAEEVEEISRWDLHDLDKLVNGNGNATEARTSNRNVDPFA